MTTQTESRPPPGEGLGASSTDRPVRQSVRRRARDQLGLWLLPLLVLVVLGGYAYWHQTAHLDSIEARALAWDQILHLTWQHIELTLVATLLVLVIAVPLGIVLTRLGLRRLAPLVVGIANTGQAAPSIGLIVLIALWRGFGFATAVLALTLYGILPVLRNTITGLQGVSPQLVEAARGMGMSATGVLLRVELPLAVPVIMSGVRTALVLVVGTASFATFISAGGLGLLIVTGITLFRYPILISGALLIGLLALLVDWAGRVLEAFARPNGI